MKYKSLPNIRLVEPMMLERKIHYWSPVVEVEGGRFLKKGDVLVISGPNQVAASPLGVVATSCMESKIYVDGFEQYDIEEVMRDVSHYHPEGSTLTAWRRWLVRPQIRPGHAPLPGPGSGAWERLFGPRLSTSWDVAASSWPILENPNRAYEQWSAGEDVTGILHRDRHGPRAGENIAGIPPGTFKATTSRRLKPNPHHSRPVPLP